MSTRQRKVSASAPQTGSGVEDASPKRAYGQGRQKLLEAVASLVAREGRTRITLRDLAREAGMRHNAIYRHFSGVDEMVEELVRDHNERLRDGLRPARQAIAHGLDGVLADMRQDLLASQHLPDLPAATLDLALKVIIQYTFELCLACIDEPDRQPEFLVQAEQVFRWCLAGAVADAAAAAVAAPRPPQDTPRRLARPGS